jgi:hypothetical protein
VNCRHLLTRLQRDVREMIGAAQYPWDMISENVGQSAVLSLLRNWRYSVFRLRKFFYQSERPSVDLPQRKVFADIQPMPRQLRVTHVSVRVFILSASAKIPCYLERVWGLRISAGNNRALPYRRLDVGFRSHSRAVYPDDFGGLRGIDV